MNANESINPQEKPIAKMDIKSGEGYCRIADYWKSENVSLNELVAKSDEHQ